LDYLERLAGKATIHSGCMFHSLLCSNLDMVMAYDTAIEGRSRALDLRNKETEGHMLRVTEMMVSVTRTAGIPETEIVNVRLGPCFTASESCVYPTTSFSSRTSSPRMSGT
jgi:hypothetical protein